MSARGVVLCAAVWIATPTPSAFAQRFAFERTLQVAGPTTLDVSTDRGTIEVVTGPAGRVVVEGAATVRVGWNVPVNAVEIARQVAAAPPIEHDGREVRLRLPSAPDAQRAVTVNYRVQVPPDTEVRIRTDSGVTLISGVAGAVDIRTQSSRVDIDRLAGVVRISTGSGAVTATDIGGALHVTTASSAFNGRGLRSSLRVTTRSGDVSASLEGTGDVNVETGSSAIDLRGVRGGLVVNTKSGQVKVAGTPLDDWTATTGSSAVQLDLDSRAGFRLDAASRSGSVTVSGANVSGSAAKHAVSGTVGGDGPIVRVRTGSGAIRVRAGQR